MTVGQLILVGYGCHSKTWLATCSFANGRMLCWVQDYDKPIQAVLVEMTEWGKLPSKLAKTIAGYSMTVSCVAFYERNCSLCSSSSSSSWKVSGLATILFLLFRNCRL
jgi:hypothetical protein